MSEQPEILFTSEEIRETVTRIAREISDDYRESRPLLVGILQGSFVFILLSLPIQVPAQRRCPSPRSRPRLSAS